MFVVKLQLVNIRILTVYVSSHLFVLNNLENNY